LDQELDTPDSPYPEGTSTFNPPNDQLTIHGSRLNADRCQALGVARVLDPITVSSGDVRLAVVDVLRAPNYRGAATRIQNEIAQLPTSADAVTWIEALNTAHPSQ